MIDSSLLERTQHASKPMMEPLFFVCHLSQVQQQSWLAQAELRSGFGVKITAAEARAIVANFYEA
jgi:hypothetical protein